MRPFEKEVAATKQWFDSPSRGSFASTPRVR